MYSKGTLILFLSFILINVAGGQNITQTIKGRVVDRETQVPLPGSSVAVLGTTPLLGTAANMDGTFLIRNVPIGRYDLKVSCVGYREIIIKDLLVTSGKEVVVIPELTENVISTEEIIIKPDKSIPVNSMASVSVRQFSVEEANRYAGGFDDPAHLASSFAGVAGTLGNNGIVIRGNAPKGLLWRMEGIEISNPNHFANMSSMGAGAITALSSQMMANSDFYTGAFPSEYGNALSGVFDIKLRTGNNERREYTIQAGLIGLDLSSEGPFVKGASSSWLFNYRYSTLTLFSSILPPEMGKLRYQDLSFKLNFPTKKYGTISIWSIGALDFQGRDAINDASLWKSDFDRQQYKTDLYMGALGINHKLIVGNKTYTVISLAATGNGLSLDQHEFSDSGEFVPVNKIANDMRKYTVSGIVNHKFNAKHTNRTGFIIDRLEYNVDIEKAENIESPLTAYSRQKGSSYLLQIYSQSRMNITDNIILNLGLHSQFFRLTGHYSIEPRMGICWTLSPVQSLSFSYGLHSQTEMLNFFFVQQQTSSGTVMPNKSLDFAKANHLVLAFERKLSEHIRLKIEPYYQRLFDVPVIPDSYFSMINLENGLYFNDPLVNKGTGNNVGMDVTLERFLNKGMYYLLTASLFDSKYRGGDNIERNTRYNKHYVINILGGKEWIVGKKRNNLFNINARLTLMGGDYMNPIDYEATYASAEIVEDVSRAFTERKPESQILSLSATFRINKPGHASIWAFNFINVLFYKEINSYYFDRTTGTVKKDINQLVIPNLSYKIEF